MKARGERIFEFKHGASHSIADENSENAAIMYTTRPVLRKSANWLVPHTIAFGGVATGSTKAKEHVQVAGISNVSGCVSVDRATSVFDAMSVGSQMLQTIEEIRPKLEKTHKSPKS